MTPEQEISIAQNYLRQTSTRLGNFLHYLWQARGGATPVQVAAHNAVNLAIEEVVAKMETLKEAMK